MSMDGLNELRKRFVLWPAVVAVICLCAVVRAQNAPVTLVIGTDHSSSATSIALSPDGKLLAAGSRDKTIKLWSATSGQIIRTLSGHSGQVNGVTFSPDGKMLASGSDDTTIILWDVNSGQIIRTLSGHSKAVTYIAFGADGNDLLSGGSGQTAILWDARTGQLVRTFEIGNVPRIPVFSFNDSLIAMIDMGGKITLWNKSNIKPVVEIQAHANLGSAVALSPNGNLLASGGARRNLFEMRMWQTSGSPSGDLGGSEPRYAPEGMVFSPDGKLLASVQRPVLRSAVAMTRITLWDVTLSLPTKDEFYTRNNEVKYIIFSPDGKALLWDEGVRGIAVRSNKDGLTATYLCFDDGSWITYTPDNYYVCSSDASKHIGWKQGDKAYAYSAFSAQFNKPEIVAERLRSLGLESTISAAASLSKNANTPSANTETPKPAPTPKDTTLPKIIITSPSVPRGQGVKPAAAPILKHSGSSLTIAGQATDESGVREVTVRGVAVRLDERGTFSAEVLLQVGDNPITVTATDNAGNRTTESFTVRRESEPPPAPPLVGGRYFALLIAVQDYEHKSVTPLEYPLSDARKIERELTTRYAFEPQNVTLLRNPDRRRILNTLAQLAGTLHPEDKLLIFYAGHGHWDEGRKQGYWLPRDAQRDSTAEWLSNSNLCEELRGIKARHILLVSDACFSGSIFVTREAFNTRPATLAEAAILELEKLPSRTAMTSGAMTGVPDRSVFVEYLLKRLAENQEPYLPAAELFGSFRLAVISNSPMVNGTRPTPRYGTIQEVGDEGGDFIFVRRR